MKKNLVFLLLLAVGLCASGQGNRRPVQRKVGSSASRAVGSSSSRAVGSSSSRAVGSSSSRAVGSSSSRARTVKNVGSSAQSKANNSFAVYRTMYPIKKVAEGDRFLYILESANNAVLFIDKETGESGELIPGIKGLYEDVRPVIEDIYVISGDRLLLVRSNPNIEMRDKLIISIYDGKSAESSETWMYAVSIDVSPNGKFYKPAVSGIEGYAAGRGRLIKIRETDWTK